MEESNLGQTPPLLEVLPLLKRCLQFFVEFGRIVHEPCIQAAFPSTWSTTWIRRIMCLCKREGAKKKIRSILDTVFENYDDSISPDIESETALLLVTALTLKSAQPNDVLKELHIS
jgi:hypothetical protein